MRYLSMFSGIEAATMAWEPLGFKAEAYCEIDPFASAVLAHRFPETPNLGDVQEADFDAIGPVDLAVFGSPCQSYSVAGKRLGLDDPRGNLALVAGQVVYRTRPRWFVFENVPGLLSSDSGWDFGTLLAAFAGYKPGSVFEPPADGWQSSGVVVEAEGGYGLAWRVLDAQFFGLAQRRKRVFVVGYLGDWRRAAAVLFERESLSRNPPPRREARENVAPTISARPSGGGGLGTDFDCDGGLIASTGNVAHCLNAGGMGRIDYESETLVTHALKGEGFDASEDGTGRGTPLVPVAFDTTQVTSKGNYSNPKAGDPCHPLSAGAHAPAIAIQERAVSENADAGPDGAGYRDDHCAYTLEARQTPQAVAFAENSRAELRLCGGDGSVSSQLTTGGGKPGQGQPCIATGWAVRRLTPRECERLQGFPDDFTLIPYRGKPADQCPDGPRYKALGNSFAVPVIRWIGERIAAVDAIKARESAA